MRWILPLLLLLAGCTITPEDPDELPEGYADPKEDLVEHLKDHPNDLDSHADLLRMQIKDGDAEGAGTTVGHALKHNGGDYRAHLLAAQFHRWQADLISAEKSLLTARDLAPDKLEPRVALSGLYNQTYLEAEELEQRRIALELADATLRSEFLLDFAYANADLGHDDQAAALASQLLADGNALAGARWRARPDVRDFVAGVARNRRRHAPSQRPEAGTEVRRAAAVHGAAGDSGGRRQRLCADIRQSTGD
jgi:hypothetical protein